MTIEALVARYGLIALFLGSGIEGEAVVLTGGILVHRGFFPLWAAMVAAACGSCLVDQLWFFAGRFGRRSARVQRIMAKPAFARAIGFFERHPTAFVFGFRFIYGLRTVSPIAIGTTRLPTPRFVVLNALAAAIWGPLFIWIGFTFGRALDPVFAHVRAIAPYAIAGAVVIGVAVAAWLRRRGVRAAD